MPQALVAFGSTWKKLTVDVNEVEIYVADLHIVPITSSMLERGCPLVARCYRAPLGPLGRIVPDRGTASYRVLTQLSDKGFSEYFSRKPALEVMILEINTSLLARVARPSSVSWNE